jgi:hypothetical protein
MISLGARRWEQAKRVLRYFYGTKEYCLITFNGTIFIDIHNWQDFAFADAIDRRSRIGFIATKSGGPVFWSNKLQCNVTLSTAETKYMAMSASSQETMFLLLFCHILPTFGCRIACPTPTYEDNESCIALATNDITTSRSKHIDIKHYYIRELVKQGDISITWCPTYKILAHILTKFSLPSSSIHLKNTRRMLTSTYSSPVTL